MPDFSFGGFEPKGVPLNPLIDLATIDRERLANQTSGQNLADRATLRGLAPGLASGDAGAQATALTLGDAGYNASTGANAMRSDQRTAATSGMAVHASIANMIAGAPSEQRAALYRQLLPTIRAAGGTHSPDDYPGDDANRAVAMMAYAPKDVLEYRPPFGPASEIGQVLPPSQGARLGPGGVPMAGAVAPRLPGGAFEQQLGQAESNGNPRAVNAGGYSGQFQFGAERLADPGVGVYQPAPGENPKANQWRGTFNIPGFPEVKTHADFLASPAAQHAVMTLHVGDIDNAIATTPGAAQLDPNGLRAVAHLGGVQGMQRFVQSGGRYDAADSNGTHLSDYYRRFAAGGGPALAIAFGSPEARAAAAARAAATPTVASPAAAADPGRVQVASATGTTGLPITANDASGEAGPTPVVPGAADAAVARLRAAAAQQPAVTPAAPAVPPGAPPADVNGIRSAPLQAPPAPAPQPAAVVPVAAPAPPALPPLANPNGMVDVTPPPPPVANGLAAMGAPTPQAAPSPPAPTQGGGQKLAPPDAIPLYDRKTGMRALGPVAGTGMYRMPDGTPQPFVDPSIPVVLRPEKTQTEIKWYDPSGNLVRTDPIPDERRVTSVKAGDKTVLTVGGKEVGSLPNDTSAAQLVDYTKDRTDIEPIAAGGRAAQTSLIQLTHMRDLASQIKTGSHGEGRAEFAALAEQYLPDDVAKIFSNWIIGKGGAAIAEQFAKLSLKQSGAAERGDLGSRGSIAAIQIYQKANPGLGLRPTANRDILNMYIVAAQADADYAQAALAHHNAAAAEYHTPTHGGKYVPLSVFEQTWQNQRNPQVYAAAMGALNGQPFEKWKEGLTEKEAIKAAEVLARADPNAKINGPGGPVSVSRFLAPAPAAPAPVAR